MAASLVVIVAVCFANGGEETHANPASIDFVFPGVGTVVVVIDGTKLSELSLRKGSVSSFVRSEDLAGISHLQLETLQVVSGMYYSESLDGVKYESVRARFGTKEQMKFGEYPEVAFTFHDGEYSHRIVWEAADADMGRKGTPSVSPDLWKGRRQPNKAPQSTPSAVTPPAGQEARQP
jgi:hypothetical protein